VPTLSAHFDPRPRRFFHFDPDEIARIFVGDNSLFNQKAPD
jgi:hypothetical protein